MPAACGSRKRYKPAEDGGKAARGGGNFCSFVTVDVLHPCQMRMLEVCVVLGGANERGDVVGLWTYYFFVRFCFTAW